MKYPGCIFLCVFLALADHAQAAVPDGTQLSPGYLQAVAAWVKNAMHMPICTLPLAVASAETLKTSLGLEGVQQARSVGAYLPGRIIVSNTVWDPDSPVAASFVVHEMVHHAQMLSGKKYPCHEAKEREAYTLQNRWLIEHDEAPLYSEDWIKNISSCKND